MSIMLDMRYDLCKGDGMKLLMESVFSMDLGDDWLLSSMSAI